MANERIELGQKMPIECKAREDLGRLFADSHIPEDERIETLPIFLMRQNLARLLFLNEIYTKILEIPGSVVQCGVRWGGDIVTLMSLRGIYEPYNYTRRIIGFDTFSGLSGVSESDKGIQELADGQFAVTPGYDQTLVEILQAHENLAPLPHLRKHEIITGDVRETVPRFMADNPAEYIALLYLDLDIYEPTKTVLEHCIDRLLAGAIVVFDEFGDRRFPGEAAAYSELSSRLHLKFQRSRFSTVTAYGIVT